jgi:hypothetical protein
MTTPNTTNAESEEVRRIRGSFFFVVGMAVVFATLFFVVHRSLATDRALWEAKERRLLSLRAEPPEFVTKSVVVRFSVVRGKGGYSDVKLIIDGRLLTPRCDVAPGKRRHFDGQAVAARRKVFFDLPAEVTFNKYTLRPDLPWVDVWEYVQPETASLFNCVSAPGATK